MLRVVVDDVPAREDLATGLDEIVREGARRMLAAALEAEVEAYVAGFVGQVGADGRRLVVRNGHARPRSVTTAAGVIEVAAPRVNDKRVDPATGERVRFRSLILPPWCRKSSKVAEVLPLLYLHGRSSGDFVPAMEEFFGSAAGPSASVITRLTIDWQDEHRAFSQRGLSGVDYVYVWVDGGALHVRLDEARLCTLVMVGSAPTGPRSWSRSLTGTGSRPSRGPTCSATAGGGIRAPVLAVGDGRVGVLGRAGRGVPGHPGAAMLGAQGRERARLPAQERAAGRRALAEIRDAEDRGHAEVAISAFGELFAAKYPKAVAKIVDDADVLLAFDDFPAEHWIHLKTTNPIGSTFSTVRLRTRVTKGPGSRAAGLAMAFKLLQAAQDRWRAVNGPHLVPLVRRVRRSTRDNSSSVPPTSPRRSASGAEEGNEHAQEKVAA